MPSPAGAQAAGLSGQPGGVFAGPLSVAVAEPSTIAIQPVADASVHAAAPSRNFGAHTTLTSDGDPVTITYLRFDLTALSALEVTAAMLRMPATNGSSGVQSLSLAGSAWSESAIAYENRPLPGHPFTSFRAGPAGTAVEADVTAAMSGRAGEHVTLVITSADADGFAFRSREDVADPVTLALSVRRTPAGGPKGVALRPFAEYWGADATAMRGDLDDLRAAGATWARIDLYKTDPPSPAFDAAVEAARSTETSLLVTVHKPPPTHDLGSESDRVAYRDWLGRMVDRFKHHVRHWEIHNEPNLHYEWSIDDAPGSDPARYAESVRRYVAHLSDAYQTIKAHDPGATVLFGGLSEWMVERYVDVLATTDAHEHFDVMSYHPYGTRPDNVMNRFWEFKARMEADPELASKPIWVTEIGFNTSWPWKAGFAPSEQEKAERLREALVRLHGAGARLPVFWYTLHENERASGYGLTIKDKRTLATEYLPAFYAFRDLVFQRPP
ncbi:MAG TPA: DNRLRE domain-containing protein [Solirubrobacteraceae bacterium]|nr:DNRLRE domain-containing protein [Solirubrobacteraceae bacterium]